MKTLYDYISKTTYFKDVKIKKKISFLSEKFENLENSKITWIILIIYV